MNVFRWAMTLTVISGLYWVYQQNDPDKAPVHPLIPVLVNQELDHKANVCVEAGPFPYDTSAPPTEWKNHIGNYGTCEAIRCNRCEDLLQAGLLSKTQGSQLDADGVQRATVRYELTTEGRALYHEDINDRAVVSSGQPMCQLGESMTGKTPDNTRTPGLCFARAMTFHKVEERLKPMKMGAERMMSFTYVAQAVDPQPFIFDERAKALLKAVPQPGNPALYPAVMTTLVLAPGGKEGYLDSGLRYGKWINGKPDE